MSQQHFCNYKLTLSYDGTAYSGWQIQPNALSIQEVLEKAVEKLIGKRAKIQSSGRTDAGVHAFEQIAHMRVEEPLDIDSIHFKLSCILPKDISVHEIVEVPPEFHARFSAKSKTYQYFVHTDRHTDPFTERFRTHIRYPLDLNLMREAARSFVGTHDFTSFANEASKGSAKRNPIKTIFSLTIEEIPGGLCFTFHGNGFLYKMVRNIMGTLLRVGSGKLPQEEIPLLFAAKDRKKAPMAASPKGLFLTKVGYE